MLPLYIRESIVPQSTELCLTRESSWTDEKLRKSHNVQTYLLTHLIYISKCVNNFVLSPFIS